MTYFWAFLVGIASNFATLIVLYLRRYWIVRELGKINWNLSGNVWWFCCDLHTVKL